MVGIKVLSVNGHIFRKGLKLCNLEMNFPTTKEGNLHILAKLKTAVFYSTL